MINNVPATFLKPCEINDGLPSENEEQSGIHIYKKWLKIKEVSTLKIERTPLDMVEARGVEPLSENHLPRLSPSAAFCLGFPSPDAKRQASGYGSR